MGKSDDKALPIHIPQNAERMMAREKTPIAEIISFIFEEHDPDITLTNESIAPRLEAMAKTAKCEEILTGRIIRGWLDKKSVRIYDKRASKLAKVFRYFNHRADSFWFQLSSLEEFKFYWRKGLLEHRSNSIQKTETIYQIVRKSFGGDNRYVFEILRAKTEGLERIFDLYVPLTESWAAIDVHYMKFTGKDLDIGQNNFLYGFSLRTERQEARPRALFFKHEGEDSMLNKHRFGLTVGASPFDSEPVACKCYSLELELGTKIDADFLSERVKFGNQRDVKNMFGELVDIVSEFIDNGIENRSVLSFNTQKWNDRLRQHNLDIGKS